MALTSRDGVTGLSQIATRGSCAKYYTTTENDMQTKKYRALQAISKSMGENNDCSVKAVAMFCNVRYTVAHRTLAALGRKKGRGCTADAIKTACNALLETEHKWLEDELGCDGKTPNTFVRKSPVKGGQLVIVRGHVIYMKDGVIHDHDGGNKSRIRMVMNHV